MKTIKALRSFTINGVPYETNDEISFDNIEQVVELNEKGFITPLTAKDLYIIKKELENKNKPYIKKNIKEEE